METDNTSQQNKIPETAIRCLWAVAIFGALSLAGYEAELSQAIEINFPFLVCGLVAVALFRLELFYFSGQLFKQAVWKGVVGFSLSVGMCIALFVYAGYLENIKPNQRLLYHCLNFGLSAIEIVVAMYYIKTLSWEQVVDKRKKIIKSLRMQLGKVKKKVEALQSSHDSLEAYKKTSEGIIFKVWGIVGENRVNHGRQLGELEGMLGELRGVMGEMKGESGITVGEMEVKLGEIRETVGTLSAVVMGLRVKLGMGKTEVSTGSQGLVSLHNDITFLTGAVEEIISHPVIQNINRLQERGKNHYSGYTDKGVVFVGRKGQTPTSSTPNGKVYSKTELKELGLI